MNSRTIADAHETNPTLVKLRNRFGGPERAKLSGQHHPRTELGGVGRIRLLGEDLLLFSRNRLQAHDVAAHRILATAYIDELEVIRAQLLHRFAGVGRIDFTRLVDLGLKPARRTVHIAAFRTIHDLQVANAADKNCPLRTILQSHRNGFGFYAIIGVVYVGVHN